MGTDFDLGDTGTRCDLPRKEWGAAPVPWASHGGGLGDYETPQEGLSQEVLTIGPVGWF